MNCVHKAARAAQQTVGGLALLDTEARELGEDLGTLVAGIEAAQATEARRQAARREGERLARELARLRVALRASVRQVCGRRTA